MILPNLKYQTTKGGGLVYALAVLAVVTVIFSGMITFVASSVRYSLSAQPREGALQIAESGLYAYRWYIAHQVDGKTAEEVSAFWQDSVNPPRGSAGADGVCGTADDDGRYEEDYDANGVQGTYSVCVTLPAPGETAAYVESRGWTAKKPNQQRTVRMRLRRPPWSEFALLAHSDIEVSSGTTVGGGVHANSGLRVEGVVDGLSSSSVTTYDYGGSTEDGVWTNGTESSVFVGGKKFPVPVQDFNSVVVAFAQIQAASDAQFSLPTKAGGQGWHLIFNADGTADLYWVKKYDNSTKEISYKAKDYKFEQTLTLTDTNAIYVRNDIWIEGVVDSGKQVTVGAHHNGGGRNHSIYINGDIVYEDQVSGTILGLAAEEDVEVIADPDTGGDSILNIHAAMLAQNGRVGRSAYGTTLAGVNVLGAIATYQDFGFADTTSVMIDYDTNLLFNAPPFFPTGSSYVIDEWEEA
jgi:hypothetical protein